MAVVTLYQDSDGDKYDLSYDADDPNDGLMLEKIGGYGAIVSFDTIDEAKEFATWFGEVVAKAESKIKPKPAAVARKK